MDKQHANTATFTTLTASTRQLNWQF